MSSRSIHPPYWVFPIGAATVGLLAGGLACQVNLPVSEPPPPSGGTVSFAAQIQPILTTACTGCHSPGGSAMLDGIPMDLREGEAYDAVVHRPSAQDAEWTLVVPGDSGSSLLYLKVSSDSPPVGVRMPRFSPTLSPSEIELIGDWIDQGALNN
jgi:mono/diheme cytochrome c family protein